MASVMRRVLVSGISGSGKTTLAREIHDRLGLPRYELDALHHGPRWVKRPEFETEVRAFADQPSWVTEEQYHSLLGDLLWSRADTLLWLDLPRPTVMHRVIRRSLARALTRRELWNGNRETFRDWLDPEHPIRWAWSRHHLRKAQTLERIARHPHLTVIHLTSATEVRRWLDRTFPSENPADVRPQLRTWHDFREADSSRSCNDQWMVVLLEHGRRQFHVMAYDVKSSVQR